MDELTTFFLFKLCITLLYKMYYLQLKSHWLRKWFDAYPIPRHFVQNSGSYMIFMQKFKKANDKDGNCPKVLSE